MLIDNYKVTLVEIDMEIEKLYSQIQPLSSHKTFLDKDSKIRIQLKQRKGNS